MGSQFLDQGLNPGLLPWECQVLAAGPSEKSRDSLFNVDEFENIVTEKRLIPDDCVVKYIPNRGPWANGGPCAQENLGAVPSLSHSPINLLSC